MKVSFHHAGIVVPDLDQGVVFYKQLLGLEELSRFEWDQSRSNKVETVINLENSAAKAAMLTGDGFNIELFEYIAPAPTGDPAADRPCDLSLIHI